MYLNCHSYYSYRYGVLSEEQLLMHAMHYGIDTIALTDINNTSACLNFIRLAPRYNVKPVIGIDYRNNVDQLYVGLAKNNNGFQALNTFLSHFLHRSSQLPEEAPPLNDVLFIYPFAQIEKMNKKKLRDNEYIGLSVYDINRFRFSKWKKLLYKCVLLQSFTFCNKKQFNTHRLLRAIGENSLLSKLKSTQHASKQSCFVPPDILHKTLAALPELVSQTKKILAYCTIHFDFSPNAQSQNIKHYTSSAESDYELLKRLCNDGLAYRYGVNPLNASVLEKRIEKELHTIKESNYVSFFLTNWDIVRYAKHKDYYHVGRGSGANSIVAYLLGITDVDPIALDLYFERFMNLFRKSPPDFDIDFSTRDRPDITRYIFNRFKRKNQVALLGAYNTFQHNATIRELGKVFGLPAHEIESVSKVSNPGLVKDDIHKLVLRYAQYIQDMPNHLTVHAAGILIAEKPIHYFSATELPPKGFPLVQFDMHIAEDIGLYKYDILGQRGLGKIKDTLSIIQYNKPKTPKIDIHNAKPFMEDKLVNQLVSKGECMGCFYVESPAMRMLLSKLGVDSYLGLVAASSIIRPGVAQSGMMRQYILRHKNPELRKQAHPIMAKIMPDTYGIMVYQEDVIKVAHYFAGLSLAEADVLRRGMSGKYRSRNEFLQVKEKFIANCRQKGFEDKVILEIWRQIESFAGYAFAKGHSASYAVESYQSLYLKAHFPLEYMVAVLNNGGGFYKAAFYIHEARKMGATILPPCVNRSNWETRIYGCEIQLGFGRINGLDRATVKRIEQARNCGGVFTSFNNFLSRVYIKQEALDKCIRVGAFSFTGISKRKLLWQAVLYTKQNIQQQHQAILFSPAVKNFSLPQLAVSIEEEAFDQIELLGFSLHSVFNLLVREAKNIPHIMVKDLRAYIGQQVSLVAQLVTVKNTGTVSGQRMCFGTFLDETGDWLDTVHFPNIARQYPFRGEGIYHIKGKVVTEFDYLSIEVHYMEKLALIEDPRYAIEESVVSTSLSNKLLRI